jgi:hypothetical protein
MVKKNGFVVIYRPWITIKRRRLYASYYGKKAFRLVIPRDKYRP